MSYQSSLTDLAPELLHQIFNCLHGISDVLALAATCRDLRALQSLSMRLPTLFLAAEREFGPLADIAQLVTYNDSQPAHIKREPQQSYPLLRQMVRIGKVGNKIVDLYPTHRWGEEQFLDRRSLTNIEAHSVRKAVYRLWLYNAAFQTRAHSRSCRMLTALVEERSALLRQWSTDDLLCIEDLRMVLEQLVTDEICPADGAVNQNVNEYCHFRPIRNQGFAQRSWNSWPPDSYNTSMLSRGYGFQDDFAISVQNHLPVPQRRKLQMTGWGDEISQYYIVQSMMKLNPRHLLHLYEKAITKIDVETYLVENCDGGDWFWDNGQTWLDTWSLVLYKRGEDVGLLRACVQNGDLGITGKSTLEEIEAVYPATV